MSSLSQQLKAISDKNASVALDRKTRSKIHSRSLIFDAKVAAAQDYDYIYQIGCEGLEELIGIDARFEKFSSTLFSEASLLFDRNVQTPEILTQVTKTLEAFINLIAPFYHVNPSLKAMEWLVRRYHINIHNAELLLLSVLPYHAQPVFTRFLNIIPKSSMPAIFSWISGYKETLKCPPASSLLKSFHNDPAFYRLYSEYLVEQLKNRTIFKDQLVFYLSNTVQVLASHARDTSKLNDDYIPVVLDAGAELLSDKRSDKYSSSLKTDIRLTVYAIVSVLCTLTPLTDDLVFGLTKSILQDPVAFSASLRRQTIIVLGQLWNYYNESDIPVAADVFSLLPELTLLEDKALLLALTEEKFNVSKFLFFYFVDRCNQGSGEAIAVLELLDVSNKLFFDVAARKLLQFVVNAELSDSARSSAISVFEQLLKSNRQRLSELLEEESQTVQGLEMLLMHTLGESETADSYDGHFQDLAIDTASAQNHPLSMHYVKCKVDFKTFFDNASSAEFARISQVLMSTIRTLSFEQQVGAMFRFVRVALHKDSEVAVSFLLRLALTPSVPVKARLAALTCVKTKLSDALQINDRLNFYLLVPILLVGLSDSNKSIRNFFASLLVVVQDQSETLNAGKPKKVKCDLYMESQIYGETEASKRSIISPQDANVMLSVIFDDKAALDDVLVDSSRLNKLVFDVLFKSAKAGLKKFGALLLKTFILNQWSLPFWPLVLKWRIWSIMSAENIAKNGSDDRFFFVKDVKTYISKRDQWVKEAAAASIDFEVEVEKPLVRMIGGQTATEKKVGKEVEWFLKALGSQGRLQVAANERLIELFPSFSANDIKLRICNELIDLIVKDSDLFLEFDPLETLQALDFSNLSMVGLLGTINIVSVVPEQGVAKRRRRSSSSTQKNMARDDISNMASTHLKKLSIILDVLENHLRNKAVSIADPELLQTLFKILTDLDYLGNDGKMPVLYAQETLASCMLLSIVQMKSLSNKQKLKFDSNSIRADLIVNSIRLSHSPQVQNRLLLVIAELASLAPEIILHSVMPIFTFMGAHTIRQDDEFSSSALQQTISKVIPAITAASTSVSTEIEFLLTSFVAAFQHIPRHRRVNLFVSLIKTLGCDQSLHTILFLIGQQFAANVAKGKIHESNSLLDFSTALLKTFSADECLQSFSDFYDLWNNIPVSQLETDSEVYSQLNARPIYGSSVVTLGTKELLDLKSRLLKYQNHVLGADEEFSQAVVSLKMKVSLVLFDDHVSQDEKDLILQRFNKVTSFILSSLDTLTNLEVQNNDIVEELYGLLKSLLNLLPLSFYISSISESLKNVSDPLSIKVAKNFAILAGSKFETEVNANSIDDSIESSVLDNLLPILINGVEQHDNTELVQAYLDTYAIIVTKFGATTQELATSSNAKFLVNSLKVITSEHGLLSDQTEVIVSALNAITSVVNVLGVKSIGFFPKILAPALKIWETTIVEEGDSEDEEDDDDEEGKMLLQGSILMLFSCLIKKLPAFVLSNLKQMLKAILVSDLIDNSIRSNILTLVVEHIENGQVLQALCNLALNDDFYGIENAGDLGLYLSAVKSTVDNIEKKAATNQSSLFMKWLIKSFEFRNELGEQKFSDNTIHSIESSFHQCGIAYVMKLNDKSFRPLFASLVRWAVSGEGSLTTVNTEVSRLTAFFRFFNKLQDNLKSIITSYFSYLLDPTIAILNRFSSGDLKETNLRRIVLHAVTSAFKYDQDDYWSHLLRFETMVDPLLNQLNNIEDSIGKYLVKAISFFVTNVSSDEYNEKLVHTLIKFISNELENSLNTKIWTIRVLKNVFQKMGEQWLSFLPTFIPYIAELLEDDDEEVEMEVRKDLVRVIENMLGEPLDRYLN